MTILVKLVCGAAMIFSVGVAHAEDKPLVDEKYSLKADREAFEKLRKDIPSDVRNSNDEKAFMDQLMGDINVPPSDVREKFSRALSKKREAFSKDMTKKRETFSKEATREREEFSQNQKNQREKFAKEKHSSEERTRFFDGLEVKRKDFYEASREKRDNFEETMKEDRKNFEDYVRAKQDEFNALHRDYTKRYQENKKEMADAKRQAEEKRKNFQKSIDQEYEQVRQKTPTYLGTEGE